jgi:hypothetical protein
MQDADPPLLRSSSVRPGRIISANAVFVLSAGVEVAPDPGPQVTPGRTATRRQLRTPNPQEPTAHPSRTGPILLTLPYTAPSTSIHRLRKPAKKQATPTPTTPSPVCSADSTTRPHLPLTYRRNHG